jgi:hypothetical protein
MPIWVSLIALVALMLVIEVWDSIKLHRPLRWESAGGLIIGFVGGVWAVLRYRMRKGSERRQQAEARAAME